ncbi:MAG TPA: hypothetical protein VH374_20775 [Polyangia bacterium]|nr:hypothetical protein [Polyangia bacterium]
MSKHKGFYGENNRGRDGASGGPANALLKDGAVNAGSRSFMERAKNSPASRMSWFAGAADRRWR